VPLHATVAIRLNLIRRLSSGVVQGDRAGVAAPMGIGPASIHDLVAVTDLDCRLPADIYGWRVSPTIGKPGNRSARKLGS
jgi:hypothetical protein